MTSWAAVAELVRAPAALTVPGDSLAGAAAAGWPFGRATIGLAASSVCLYWAGMALNDYADREVDAVERPSRPIPSGRVSPGLALDTAAALTVAGVTVAGITGGLPAVAVALPLAGVIWAYDLKLKSTAAGPVAMAAARSLDVLLGAGAGRLRSALPAALTMGAHTLTVTYLSRREVSGATPTAPKTALAAALATQATSINRVNRPKKIAEPGSSPQEGRGTGLFGELGRVVLAGAYLGPFSRALVEAARDPSAGAIQRAVGAGIHAMMPLQAGLVARAGSLRAAVPIAAAFPLARRLSRRVSPT